MVRVDKTTPAINTTKSFIYQVTKLGYIVGIIFTFGKTLHCLCAQMNNSGNKRAPTTATQRLKQDYLRIKKDPVPYICAEPLPSNILEW